MKKILRFILISLAAIALFSTAASARFVPTEPILPLDKVKPGMEAWAHTVLSGTKITPFKVRIVGVVPRRTSPKALILIKIEDKDVVANGGVAAGMSGSPVYVGGKLIGAIGYSWSFADRSLGLVTPIEEMTKAFDWKDRVPDFKAAQAPAGEPESGDKVASADKAETSADKTKEAISFDVVISADEKSLSPTSGDKKNNKKEKTISQDIVELAEAMLKPLSMPLLTDGLSPRMSEYIGRRMGYDLIPLGASSPSASIVNLKKTLKPGAAMGVSLVWGDIQMGGIGTLTAVDKEGRFLAFGHPMEEQGAVAMPLTEASIIRVIPSAEHSFKLGYQGPMIGLVTQDRPEAIGGWFGKLAPANSYTVRFHDADSGRQVTKRFQTVADAFAAPELGSLGMLAIIDDQWARKGEGSAILKYRFSGGGLTKGWERRNIFFDEKDLLKSLFKEFDELAKLFALNQFREIKPFGVEMDVEVTRSPRVVFIEKLVIVDPKDSYKPGDKIELAVTLRPWRKSPVVKKLALHVPPKAVGLCEIVVRGGGIEEPEQEALLSGLRAITNLDDLMRELSVQETNNQIVAEIGGPELPDIPKLKDAKAEDKDGDEAAESDEEGDDGGDEEAPLPKAMTDDRLRSEKRAEIIKNGGLVIVDTNYYVEGALRKFIKIKSPKGEEELSEAEAKELLKGADKPPTHEKKDPGKRPEEMPELRFQQL